MIYWLPFLTSPRLAHFKTVWSPCRSMPLEVGPTFSSLCSLSFMDLTSRQALPWWRKHGSRWPKSAPMFPANLSTDRREPGWYQQHPRTGPRVSAHQRLESLPEATTAAQVEVLRPSTGIRDGVSLQLPHYPNPLPCPDCTNWGRKSSPRKVWDLTPW